METIEFNLVLAADDNYLIPAIETIASVIRFKDNIFYNIYLITDNISLEKIESSKKVLEKINSNITFNRILVSNNDFAHGTFRKDGHLTLAAYYRIMLSELLPDTVGKLLYLDCDILVIKSLKELYSTDISDYSCAVCLDDSTDNDEIYSRLSYEKKYGYFNSGMMLINLEWWRKNNIQEITFEYIKNNPDILYLHDQDALNHVLKGTCLLVPYRYNLLQGFLFEDNYYDEKKEACVIHYCSAYKPWHIESNNPYKKEYRNFFKEVFGKKCKVVFKTSGLDRLKWILKYLLNVLGIKKFDDFRVPYI